MSDATPQQQPKTITATVTPKIWAAMESARHVSEYYYRPGYALAAAAYLALRDAGWKRTGIHDGASLDVMADIHWLSGTDPRIFYVQTDSQLSTGKAYPLAPLNEIAAWIAAAHKLGFEFRPLEFQITAPAAKPKAASSPIGGWPLEDRPSLALR